VTHNQSIGFLYSQNGYGQHRYDLLKMSVNGVSTIFVFSFQLISLRCNNINLESNCWTPVWAKMILTISLPPPNNGCPWSVNNFWSCNLNIQWAILQHQPIIVVLASFEGNKATDNIAPHPEHEHQRSINDFWSCIKDYQSAVQQLQPIIYVLAVSISKNDSDDIANTC